MREKKIEMKKSFLCMCVCVCVLLSGFCLLKHLFVNFFKRINEFIFYPAFSLFKRVFRIGNTSHNFILNNVFYIYRTAHSRYFTIENNFPGRDRTFVPF